MRAQRGYVLFTTNNKAFRNFSKGFRKFAAGLFFHVVMK